MKFNVDDRILMVYRELPEVFKLGDVRERISSNRLGEVPDPTIHVNLKRMEEVGLITRIDIPGRRRGRKYHRNFEDIKEWFETCVINRLREMRREEVVKV